MPPTSPFQGPVTGHLALFHARRLAGLILRGARRVAAHEFDRGQLPPTRANNSVTPLASGVRPRALIVDQYAPRPEIDSGSARMVAIVQILAEMGLPAVLITDSAPAAPRTPDSETQPPGMRGLVEWMAHHRADVRLVVLSRHTTAAHWMPLIRAVLPDAHVVFDTVDLHYLRELRQAEQSQSRVLRLLASVTKRRELRTASRADCVWVVSHVEKQLLESECPAAHVSLVSNITDPLPDLPPFSERDGFLFVGNFRHRPNVDALEWVHEWWPDIRRVLPRTPFRIAGASMPRSLHQRLSLLEGVEILGHVDDLKSLLKSSRVMLAPLRYGAGVKGKINDAFSAGLPVVATTCAIEGMITDSNPCALVADSAKAFADAAIRAHTDEQLWQRLSSTGLAQLIRCFSRNTAKEAIRESLRMRSSALDGQE